MRKPFIAGSLNTTFAINQRNTQGEEPSSFIEPTSILMRVGAGFQFNERWATSVNFGFDHHFQYIINSIPLYGGLRYNFVITDGEAFFIETSFGRIIRPSERFENGNYYKIGVGLLSLEHETWNGSLHIDFHRKKLKGFIDDNLDSISLGVGFSLF